DVLTAVDRLGRAFDPVAAQVRFTDVARTVSRRAALFDELRTALRLVPKPVRGQAAAARSPSTEEALQKLRDVQASVGALAASLRERCPERGPAQNLREAIALILRHLDQHGKNLWGHVVTLPPEAGSGVRLVDRTNNRLEGFFGDFKRGERRRSGRKILTKDLEDLPPQAAL
ncbi:MAG: hypothetical protein GY953_20060, partial [bacterium]|nr:hypothetical protein [bacterium]